MTEKTVKELYQSLYAEHGPTLEGIGWSSIQAQLTRFNTIRDCYKGVGTVLDVGCGYGDLSLFFTDYYGIDIVPEYIDEARRKYPKKGFGVGDIMDPDLNLPKFDYVFAVGVLSFQLNPIRVIQRMWDLTAHTLAFTWLDANPHDVKTSIAVCECNIYSIRHDYLPNDTCVYMHRKFPGEYSDNFRGTLESSAVMQGS